MRNKVAKALRRKAEELTLGQPAHKTKEAYKAGKKFYKQNRKFPNYKTVSNEAEK